MEKEKFGLVSAASLPLDILLLVFKRLSIQDIGQASQVCSAWRDAAYEKSIWKGVEVKLYLRLEDKSHIFSNFVRRGIKQFTAVPYHDNGLKELLLGVPNIESLKVPAFDPHLREGCFLINAFTRPMETMRKFELHSLRQDKVHICVVIISHYLTFLKELTFSLCPVDDMALQILSSGLIHLEKLTIFCSFFTSNRGIGCLSGAFPEIATGIISLKHLGLNSCLGLGDEALQYISCGLVNLTILELCRTNVTDTGLKYIASMTQLRKLSLSCCKISDTGISRLIKENLKVTKNVTGLLSLEYLEVKHCTMLTDRALQDILGLINLKCIDFSGTSITDHGLKHIALMKNLEQLILAGCFISDTGLLYLTAGTCNKATGEALPLTSPLLENLKSLDIGRTAVTNLGLKHIAKLKNLQTLSLAECEVSSRGLLYLVEGKLKLTDLIISKNYFFIWHGRAQIAELFRQIEVEVQECKSSRS